MFRTLALYTSVESFTSHTPTQSYFFPLLNVTLDLQAVMNTITMSITTIVSLRIFLFPLIEFVFQFLSNFLEIHVLFIVPCHTRIMKTIGHACKILNTNRQIEFVSIVFDFETTTIPLSFDLWLDNVAQHTQATIFPITSQEFPRLLISSTPQRTNPFLNNRLIEFHVMLALDEDTPFRPE